MDEHTRQGIRDNVQEHYSDVARAADESCCATPACCGSDNVPIVPDSIPLAAVTSARGCGSPLTLANLRPGEVVLDLGSGGGLDALLAAQRVGERGFVYGLDANPDMLELAQRNATKAGIRNARFLSGDLEQVPLPAQTVDVILSNCVINLTPDKRQALTEAWRVLRPGGRLAVSDIVVDPDLEGLGLPADDLRQRLSWASCSAGALTRQELELALQAAGFEAINLQVLYRRSADELTLASGKSWEPLSSEQLQAVACRFTSMAITAHRPA